MKKLFAVFLLSAAAPALAQNAGTVANHAFAIGKGQGVTGYTSLLCASGQIAVGQATDPICRTVSGDWTLNAAGVSTLATVNANVGSFGSVTQCAAFTVNGKGLITAASAATCTPAVGSITGLGTGAATALGINVGLFGSFVTMNGVLGTPSTGTATNLTGLPISTGVSGLGTGVAAGLGQPASGTGGPVLATAPTVTGLTVSGTLTPLGLIDASGAGAGQIKFPAVKHASADANTLDNYAETPCTPILSFGGGTTGVTYSKQFCQATVIGNMVSYLVEIILTNKGSSSGANSIGLLGIPTSAANNSAAAVQVNNLTATAITAVQAQLQQSSTAISLSRYSVGTSTALVDTDFTNTSVIKVSGIYFVP